MNANKIIHSAMLKTRQVCGLGMPADVYLQMMDVAVHLPDILLGVGMLWGKNHKIHTFILTIYSFNTYGQQSRRSVLQQREACA